MDFHEFKLFIQAYPKLLDGVEGSMVHQDWVRVVAKNAGFRKIEGTELRSNVLKELHDFIVAKYG